MRACLIFALGLSVTLGCEPREPARAPSPGETEQLPVKAPEPATPKPPTPKPREANGSKAPEPLPEGWRWEAERFGDVRILRYRVVGWEQLDLKMKKLLFYMTQASLSGRDIVYDQQHRHGLRIRRTLEAVLQSYSGDKAAPAYKALESYARHIWWGHGHYHPYTLEKLKPGFTQADLEGFVAGSDPTLLPLDEAQTAEQLLALIGPFIFDPEVEPTRVSRDSSKDLVQASATNFYAPEITQKDVEDFYAKVRIKDDPKPVMYGLNSRLAKDAQGKVVEQVWKVEGMYGPAIEKVVYWLEKAAGVAENDAQKAALDKLVAYYRSGDLRDFDAYNVAWVQDTASRADLTHGFIESYGDPMDMRGTFQGLVQLADPEATERIAAISKEAQFFESNMPIAEAHKKPNVKGISARVIQVVAGQGDSGPIFPIGVNLPNSDWIREHHGSKSINLGNIVEAYDAAFAESGVAQEFLPSKAHVARAEKYASLADKLATDMHEVIGHASGRLNEGVAGPAETLKSYAGTLEEARADLVALYWALDDKLIEIGVMPDKEVGRAYYDDYFRAALLTQLARVPLGETLKDSHARNRQLNAAWVVDKGRGQAKGGGDVVQRLVKDGKTYFVVRDYDKARELFGQLLGEIQRIKSEGDYEAGKTLVETWGVRPDPKVHEEVKARWEALGIPKYSGFINPAFEAQTDDAGEITDVRISYPTDFAAQHLAYSRDYALLPHDNTQP